MPTTKKSATKKPARRPAPTWRRVLIEALGEEASAEAMRRARAAAGGPVDWRRVALEVLGEARAREWRRQISLRLTFEAWREEDARELPAVLASRAAGLRARRHVVEVSVEHRAEIEGLEDWGVVGLGPTRSAAIRDLAGKIGVPLEELLARVEVVPRRPREPAARVEVDSEARRLAALRLVEERYPSAPAARRRRPGRVSE